MSRKSMPERLVDRLAAKGFEVRSGANGIQYPLGRWRHEDVARWECWGRFVSGKHKTVHECHVFCWSTITEAVRYGFDLHPDGDAWTFSAFTRRPNLDTPTPTSAEGK